ncbi:MAG: ABC transporter permease [Bacteroidia bacterium]
MITKLAWRNVWRNKVRSAVIIAAVAFGMWAAIFILAYNYGMVEQRISTVINNEISHIQLHNKEFRKDYDIKYAIPQSDKVINNIRKINGVKAVSGRLIVKGMIANASGSAGVQINGVEPKIEKTITNINKKIREGEFFPAGKKNQVVIGEKLAKKMNLKLKSKVVISFQEKGADLASGAFRVCGIFKTQKTPFDESNIFIRMDEINALNQSENEATEFAVLLQSNDLVEPVKKQLQAMYKDLEIKTWMEISPEMELTVSSLDMSLNIFVGIILLALAFGIINTMLMSILERRQELGMMMALGMNRFRVFRMIMLETVFLVLSACPFGIVLALLTIAYFGNKGIDLSRFSEALENFGYDAIIYPAIRLPQLLRVLIMVIITALISSLFPARRALKLNPAEAIKK